MLVSAAGYDKLWKQLAVCVNAMLELGRPGNPDFTAVWRADASWLNLKTNIVRFTAHIRASVNLPPETLELHGGVIIMSNALERLRSVVEGQNRSCCCGRLNCRNASPVKVGTGGNCAGLLTVPGSNRDAGRASDGPGHRP